MRQISRKVAITLHHGFGGPPWNRGGGRRGGGWFMQPPMWGFLQPCLLLLLAEGPKHGYSLMEELGQRQLLGSDVDVGNLYRTLRRLEAEGLVESAWSEPGPGPNKRVYQITTTGREMLQQWAGAMEQRTSLINRFLGEYHRIFGSDAASPPSNLFFNDEDNPI
jgi:PadR family transcriptional regulator, regulatory protein PadR